MKNILAIIFLVLFFGGFLWVIGGDHAKSMSDIVNNTSQIQAEPTQITVDAYSCHYLLPNAFDKVINRFICWSCVDMADNLSKNFIISNSAEYCGGRGKVNLLFTRKAY